MTSYTVSGVPGVTYYITVFAVNALGPGPIDNYSTVKGEIMITIITINFICHAVSMFPTTATTNTQPIIIVSTAQDSSTRSTGK